MQTFATYSEAKVAGEVKDGEIHKNSAGAGLTPNQSCAALAAFERLEGYYRATGERVSLKLMARESTLWTSWRYPDGKWLPSQKI